VVITMKQGNAAGSMMDLDDLERQLNAAVGSRKSVGDDPLAELARIVGRDDVLAGAKAASKLSTQVAGTTAVQRIAPSFDDFLKVPPRPASGAMPSHTPAIEPLFPEIIPQKGQVEARDHFGDLADIEDLNLRPVIDQAEQDEVLSQGSLTGDASLVEDESLQETEAESGIFVDEANFRDLETSPEHLDKVAADVPVLEASPSNNVKKDKFDDMLAEFEAAMKDVGAEKSTPESVPSLAPIVIPPPPAELAYSKPAPSSMPSSFGMGAVAAGTMVAGTLVANSMAAGGSAQERAYDTAAADEDKRSKKRRGLMLAGGVLGVALIGIASLVTSGNVSKQAVGTNAPMIAAKPGVIKERPINPGGVEVPNQDKEVLQTKVADPKAPERVAPREEQPVDLTQAQRLAQSQQLVRQIPGVAIVAPISTTPPPTAPAAAPVPGASPSVAGSQPVPRPVASVPISITGQPIAPTAATPAVPPVAPPVVSAPATPSTTAPVQAPAVASQPPAAAAEPRRVRAVPIRSETAEAAPSRSQSQPRIVQANPNRLTAEEPDAANAPLRITPQANRAPTRVATAQPAPTQTTNSQAVAPASGGSGFAVQLAAEGSEDAARSKFNRVKSQHSEVLGSYNPNIRSAEVNGKSVYRVRVGSLSREEAVSLCERLKASGGNCFVARN
jgi:SPOR domain